MKKTNIVSGSFHGGSILIAAAMIFILCSNNVVMAQDKNLVVRIARLQIDSTQMENYKVALKEGMEAAVRIEPGVLTLYAVYEKDKPTHVTVFEIYANADAFKAHLETPHFKKYKSTTKENGYVARTS